MRGLYRGRRESCDKKMRNIFTADIGGTNSRFAYFKREEQGKLSLVDLKWLKTAEASSFKNLIANLTSSDFSLKPSEADIAVFAVAGPIEQGVRCSPPFISWDIDISAAHRDFGFKKTYLINDFVAQAYACRSHIGETAERIKPGTIVKNATAAVIGAGTALGKAALVHYERSGYLAVPSEGGHASFPFESQKECEFQEFLMRELKDRYITWNKVVSGQGLSYLHQFLTGEKSEPQDVVMKILPESETLVWAARFYGRACRNYALETLALGGVYIAGGVAAKTPEVVIHKAFTEEFNSSDTLPDLLINIPVFLIREQNSGLWGAAVLGMQELRQT
jgi:glucokinase